MAFGRYAAKAAGRPKAASMPKATSRSSASKVYQGASPLQYDGPMARKKLKHIIGTTVGPAAPPKNAAKSTKKKFLRAKKFFFSEPNLVQNPLPKSV